MLMLQSVLFKSNIPNKKVTFSPKKHSVFLLLPAFGDKPTQKSAVSIKDREKLLTLANDVSVAPV